MRAVPAARRRPISKPRRYRAPDVLGGAMMEGGAAIPVESVALDPANGRQRRISPVPSGTVPGGQGNADPALPPALPVAAGPVVPVPGTVAPVPDVPGLAVPVAVVPVPVLPVPVSVVPVPVVPVPVVPVLGVGEATALALLPVRPEAPTPAPVLLPLPPLVCAKARPDRLSSKAAAKGRVFERFMGGSHIRGGMEVNRLLDGNVPSPARSARQPSALRRSISPRRRA